VKLILKIKDGSSRYDYNAWTVAEYEDGTVTPDTRLVATDDRKQFLARLDHILSNAVANLDIHDNCIYCGQRCQDGEMCDEQQADGFHDKTFTRQEFWKLLEDKMRDFPTWRKGQAVFNLMWSLDPEEAEKHRSSKIDPFFNDGVVKEFVNACIPE